MGLLPWSLGLLCILSLLCFSQFSTLAEEILLTRTTVETLHESTIESLKRISSRANNFFRKKGDDGKHAFSRRLHLPALLRQGGADEETKEIFFKLLDFLYGNLPLFSAKKRSQTELRALFEEALNILQKAPPEISSPEKLNGILNIELDEPLKSQKEHILRKIINGHKGELHPGRCCSIEPLFKYFSTKQCLNGPTMVILAHVQPELLLFLFKDRSTVKRVIARREEISAELRNKNTDSNLLQEQFKQEFEPLIPTWLPQKSVNFSIDCLKPGATETVDDDQ